MHTRLSQKRNSEVLLMANRNKYELTPKGKIGLKKQEIIESGNIVDIDDNDIHEIMKEYGYDSYDIKLWGDVELSTPSGEWLIVFKDRFIELLHRSNLATVVWKNYRGHYHVQNVYYDLDYCVKSIKEHDLFKLKGIRTEIK